MKKRLVAYFSASGVTKAMAEKLAKVAQADVYEIKPVQKYTSADLDWTNKKSRSSIEMEDLQFRPAIATTVSNMEEYDVVFVGYPIWWYREPSIIDTFLESYDFTNKTIIPFATSGSSGFGNSEEPMHQLAPQANWKKGKMLNRTSEETIRNWIAELSV